MTTTPWLSETVVLANSAPTNVTLTASRVFFSLLPTATQEIKSLIVCEGFHVGLTCPEDQRPVVLSAFWGRQDNLTCPHQTAIVGSNCSQSSVTRTVAMGCSDVNHECHFTAVTETLGDPCPGNYKYLNATYTCTRKWMIL